MARSAGNRDPAGGACDAGIALDQRAGRRVIPTRGSRSPGPAHPWSVAALPWTRAAGMMAPSHTRPASAMRLVVAAFTVLALAAPLSGAAAPDARKVLRIGLDDITSLDPQQGTDLYSTRVAMHIFEGLYEFDYLASPAKVVPNTAEALPAITDGGRTGPFA